VPIHGEFRHLMANARLGELMGIPHERVLVCEDGDVLELTDTGVETSGRVPAGYLYVDGIVGDVGSGVLRDRRVLASEGVVVVVVTVDTQTGKVLTGPEIITRGWVYAPEAEDLLDEACDTIAATVERSLAAGVRDVFGFGFIGVQAPDGTPGDLVRSLALDIRGRLANDRPCAVVVAAGGRPAAILTRSDLLEYLAHQRSQVNGS